MNVLLFSFKVVKVTLVVVFCLILARACAWADTGSRGECPVETSFWPF